MGLGDRCALVSCSTNWLALLQVCVATPWPDGSSTMPQPRSLAWACASASVLNERYAPVPWNGCQALAARAREFDTYCAGNHTAYCPFACVVASLGLSSCAAY